jgi:hypothetical protein
MATFSTILRCSRRCRCSSPPVERRHGLDFAVTLSCGVLIFSKDHGAVAVLLPPPRMGAAQRARCGRLRFARRANVAQ